MRASSAARLSRGSATATTLPPRARGRSAAGSQHSSARRPADMLAIQLDDRADYVGALAAAHAARARARRSRRGCEARRRLERARGGRRRGLSARCGISSAGVAARAFSMIAAPAIARWPDYAWRAPERFTEVAWRLVGARPQNLLDPRFADWDAWLADVARRSALDMPAHCANLAGCNWGAVNTVRIRHPISESLPALAGFLDMPSEPLSGDWSVPRVQSPQLRRVGTIRASRQGAKPRVTCTCRAGRAAIPCRRSIVRDTRTGRRVVRLRSCRDRPRTSCGSRQKAPDRSRRAMIASSGMRRRGSCQRENPRPPRSRRD